jgi:hypothetical protein
VRRVGYSFIIGIGVRTVEVSYLRTVLEFVREGTCPRRAIKPTRVIVLLDMMAIVSPFDSSAQDILDSRFRFRFRFYLGEIASAIVM